MLFTELAQSIRDEVQALHADEFYPIVTETKTVPHVDDPDITYPNLITMTQQVKLLESCVLYVDLRESTRISLQRHEYELTRLYSAYIRAMTRCGHQFGGHVRNIIGDRVMVVFDRQGCFLAAVNTAILMNSVLKYILDPAVYNETIAGGVGIDFGPMLVTKTGVIKRGVENTSNKSLVWLGKPANIASKLTDQANKAKENVVSVAYAAPNTYGNWVWRDQKLSQFVSELQHDYTRILRHRDPNVASYLPQGSHKYPPILITEAVLAGLQEEAPTEISVVENWWREQYVDVTGYNGRVFGGDIFFTPIKEM